MAVITPLQANDNTSWYFAPRRNEIITVLIVGLVTGIVLAGLSFLIDHYIIQTIFCHQGSTGLCTDTGAIAFNVSLGLGVLGAIAWLARQRIFRPALVVLPVAVVLWSLPAQSVLSALAGHV